jgi:PleD family two-component response regulator
MIIDMMIITPDREQRRVIREALDGLPIRICAERGTAKEAFDAFRVDPVDIIIGDLFIGEITGLEAVKTLKKSSERIKFILLTRLRERSIIDKAFRFGASDVLIYPCDKSVIRDTVKHRLAELHAIPT